MAEQGLQPWDGVRWTAVAGSPHPSHAEAVGERAVDRAVASLAEHRAYLAALSDETPADYARAFLGPRTVLSAQRFGGRPAVSFQLYPR
jgi:hypothetical protein